MGFNYMANPKQQQSQAGASVSSTEQKTATPTRPQGIRIDGYFGPGLLRPGIGKIVQRTAEPQFCGVMVCRLFSYSEAPNKKDPAKISRRYAGEFYGEKFDGAKINAASGFLPSSIDAAMKGVIDAGQAPASFAGEIWCEPDEEGRSTPLGYRYVVYDRRPRGASDPLQQLAIESGIMPAAPTALPAPSGTVDPETGEISS